MPATSTYRLQTSHYASPSSPLSAVLQQQWERGNTPLCRLPLQLNRASVGVVNSMTLEASFPVSRRPQRQSLSEDPEDYPSHTELLGWAAELRIQLGDLIPTKADELRVLQLDRYNQGVTHKELFAGDLVLLHQKESAKLEAQWRGPFVVDKAGDHASFHIRQISGRRIKRTFHVDDLRLFQPWTGHLKLSNEPTYPTSQTLREPSKKKEASSP